MAPSIKSIQFSGQERNNTVNLYSDRGKYGLQQRYQCCGSQWLNPARVRQGNLQFVDIIWPRFEEISRNG